MAGDAFNDPKTMEAISAASQRMSSAMEQTKTFASELSLVLSDVLRTSTEIEKGLRSVGADEATIETYKKIHESLVSDASALQNIVGVGKKLGDQDKKRSRELTSQTRILKEMGTISKQLASERSRHESNSTAEAKKQSELDDKKKRDKAEEAKRMGYISRQASETAQFVAQTAGLGGVLVRNSKGWELSVAGVLKLFLDMFNVGEKLEGFAGQTAVQFASFNGSLEKSHSAIAAASKATKELKDRFYMTAQEAGAVLTTLARAGIEEQEMGVLVQRRNKAEAEYQSLASRMVSVQFTQGRSVEEQLKNIMDLRNNYNTLVTSAQTLDALMGDIGRRIPGLSPKQAVSDIGEMAKGMRLFNLDVLDSMTLFHSLSRDAEEYRKKVAEAKEKAGPGGKFEMPEVTSGWGGLVTAPMDVQRKFMGFLSNMGNLNWGAQSILGRRVGGGGATTGAQIESFNAMLKKEGAAGYVDAFRGMIEDVMEKTANMGENRRVGIVDVMKNIYGADEELSRYIAENIMAGKYNTKGLEDLKKTYQQDIESMKTDAEKKEKLGQDLLKAGTNIADNMKTVEQWLRSVLEKKLVPVVKDLVRSMDELSKTFKIAFADKLPGKSERSEVWKTITGTGSKQAEAAFRRNLSSAGVAPKDIDTIVNFAKDEANKEAERQGERYKDVQRKRGDFFVTGGGAVGQGMRRTAAEEAIFKAPPGKIAELLKRMPNASSSEMSKIISLLLNAIDAHGESVANIARTNGSRAKRASDKAKAQAAETKQEHPGYPLTKNGGDRGKRDHENRKKQ